jgi:hypothetical protein
LGEHGDGASEQSESLREVASLGTTEIAILLVSRCIGTIRHETSRRQVQSDPRDLAGRAAMDEGEAPVARETQAPTTSDEALRLAIKLAVDAGAYERAATLLDVARRTTSKPAIVATLALVRSQRRRE